MTNKLYPYTFADSGRCISYSKLSFNTFTALKAQVEKANPVPDPPLVEVVYPNETRKEPNTSDPAYLKAVAARRDAVSEALNRLIVKRSAVIELTEADKADVAQLRTDLKEEGVELSVNDKEVFLWHLCITTPEEMREFVSAVSRRSVVTEEAKAEARESFRAAE